MVETEYTYPIVGYDMIEPTIICSTCRTQAKTEMYGYLQAIADRALKDLILLRWDFRNFHKQVGTVTRNSNDVIDMT